jgi:phosphoserine phosphatase
MPRCRGFLLVLGLVLSFLAAPQARARDPLPSWNDGAAKQAIVRFVGEVTKQGGPSYVPPSERIATFDNDGTLWVEKPIYTQLVFAIDRVKELAPQHPEWKTTQPFQAVLEGDLKTALASGEKGLLELVMATHTGMTADEFTRIVSDWIATAKHPRFEHLYTQCVYQPQLELLQYLRDNGFATFIVSGGGIEFMRPWTDRVYGVPSAQVVGSSVVTEFQIRDGKPVLVRQSKVNFIDDKAGKPVGIYQHIGLRPILAFGNSDSDMQMIQYTKGGGGLRLGLFLHHTDADREYAYDRKSPVGTLDKVLDMASAQDWIIVDMKRDWKVVFPFEKR